MLRPSHINVGQPNMRVRSICLAAGLSLSALPGAAPASSLSPFYAFQGLQDGAQPAANLLEYNGRLYGTAANGGNWASGTVFSIDPATNAETTLSAFQGGADGSQPRCGLIAVGNLLYGTTARAGRQGAGTLFAIDPATGKRTVAYSFTGGLDGAAPQGGLVDVGGSLYGVTAGDSGSASTLFRFNPSSGVESPAYTFPAGTHALGPLLATGTTLYGTANDTVFSFDTATSTYTTLHSFAATGPHTPSGGLALVSGLLYGTLSATGQAPGGGLYSTNPSTGATTLLFTFTGNQTGLSPMAGLISIGNLLYGTVSMGGSESLGGVFSYDLTANTEKLVYSFQAEAGDGATPTGALTDVAGALYGTNQAGGTGGNLGTIYKIDAAQGTEQILHTFHYATPTVNSAFFPFGGKLFAVSSNGGSAGVGDILSVDPKTKKVAIAYAFTGGADGATPLSGLAQVGTSLYGTTSAGGDSFHGGVVYAFSPATNAEHVVYTVTSGADGQRPVAALTPVGKTLYGTTTLNGTYANGVVFRIATVGGKESTLNNNRALGGPRQTYDDATALTLNNGKLFGLRANTQAMFSVIYGVDLTTHAETVLGTLADSVMLDTNAHLSAFVAVNGVLYATTPGDTANAGTITTLNPASGAIATAYGFEGGADGARPSAALLDVGGKLYGSTLAGGTNNLGTIFVFDPATATKTTLYSFTGGADGAAPAAALVDVAGVLYGTTTAGSDLNRGAAFTFTP